MKKFAVSGLSGASSGLLHYLAAHDAALLSQLAVIVDPHFDNKAAAEHLGASPEYGAFPLPVRAIDGGRLEIGGIPVYMIREAGSQACLSDVELLLDSCSMQLQRAWFDQLLDCGFRRILAARQLGPEVADLTYVEGISDAASLAREELRVISLGGHRLHAAAHLIAPLVETCGVQQADVTIVQPPPPYEPESGYPLSHMPSAGRDLIATHTSAGHAISSVIPEMHRKLYCNVVLAGYDTPVAVIRGVVRCERPLKQGEDPCELYQRFTHGEKRPSLGFTSYTSGLAQRQSDYSLVVCEPLTQFREDGPLEVWGFYNPLNAYNARLAETLRRVL